MLSVIASSDVIFREVAVIADIPHSMLVWKLNHLIFLFAFYPTFSFALKHAISFRFFYLLRSQADGKRLKHTLWWKKEKSLNSGWEKDIVLSPQGFPSVCLCLTFQCGTERLFISQTEKGWSELCLWFTALARAEGKREERHAWLTILINEQQRNCLPLHEMFK